MIYGHKNRIFPNHLFIFAWGQGSLRYFKIITLFYPSVNIKDFEREFDSFIKNRWEDAIRKWEWYKKQRQQDNIKFRHIPATL